MVRTMDRYAELRKHFLDVANCYINQSDLDELKHFYADVIDSVRTSEYIENIEYLILILEKRGLIRFDNITPLKDIAKHYFNGLPINNDLDRYESDLRNYTSQYSPKTNLYRHSNEVFSGYPTTPNHPKSAYPSWVNSKTVIGTPEQPTLQGFQTTFPVSNAAAPPVTSYPVMQGLSEQEKAIQSMVFLRVSDRLGRYWRDVARYLNVKESDIDKIEAQYNTDLKEKAHAALKIFAAESDTNSWQKNLKIALEQARRKDLKELVEDLLF
ncbi:uncharacterized protein LOC105687548 isoform X3 [Athalia rosae]|uniref:uncharacterized protein LOC105687548 isoform X3 n=1 Tax=Athalia rosae TaxID=37344 RepID=UPI0006269357|nr:uncharacterized protein LOC105687548 isoform X3 [Athalia rosae]